MELNRAAEHLQVIRTLMERSALYRRALAPIMIFAGVLGTAAALAGRLLFIVHPVVFICYWYAVAAIGITGAFLMVRRQAWQQDEEFWSPPTRRVAQAMLPPLAAGFVFGLLLAIDKLSQPPPPPGEKIALDWLVLFALPLVWVVLYGCALHAAGFFTTRGMRLFGWLLTAGGCLGFLAGRPAPAELATASYAIMGSFFGLLHVAYGVYLYFTEPRRNET